ncbi:predicted protein [Chaetomium globosum CBS 148.51]|uniref:Uncharacterized protein n=1 Tax=Chaetomium globosum (strain ATCC 6205 / CBS 148.51 / DSM 1962 / NBRC 6347 / NRRL 1970) TaxID=306901 RepID=Q2H3H0_CHAGB|nr:uncharacterized protein CHGG_06795 [Chaetomium globosum CBS 148.51]EAQ90176.1 predicted protein [Chaetomium globosum CBS 148.51]
MAQSRGILGLPDVVLGRICSQFCPHCAGEDCLGGFKLPDSFEGPEYFGTLASLNWVNLRIGRLAQATRLHVFCSRRDSLPLLVRTLLDRPQLGENIRVIRLGNRDKDSHRQCVLQELGTPQAADTLKELTGLAEMAKLDFLSTRRSPSMLAPFEQLPRIEDSFFSLGDFYGSSQFWMSGDAPVAIPRIANSRLNAFLLLKLAKKAKAVAILGEWPLAVFPELRHPAPETVAGDTIQANHPDSLLPEVETLRLDSSNENPHRRSGMCVVDMNKIVGVLSHASNARNLEIRGGNHLMSGQKARDICRPSLKNITALHLDASSGSAITSILLCCNPENLKHFRFTIPHVYYANIPGRTAFTTVPSFSAFTALRGLTISADNIYYPSVFPRVLLRDGNTSDGSTDDGNDDDENPGDQTTSDENTGTGHSTGGNPAAGNANKEETAHKPRFLRLINFLPRGIETFEVVGIYAIHLQEVMNIPLECRPDGKLPNLKRVILRGLPDGAGVLGSVTKCEYPVPLEYGEDIFDDWYHVMRHSHDFAPYRREEVAACYAEAGVEYAFDMPEYFIHEYIGEWESVLHLGCSRTLGRKTCAPLGYIVWVDRHDCRHHASLRCFGFSPSGSSLGSYFIFRESPGSLSTALM